MRTARDNAMRGERAPRREILVLVNPTWLTCEAALFPVGDGEWRPAWVQSCDRTFHCWIGEEDGLVPHPAKWTDEEWNKAFPPGSDPLGDWHGRNE